MKQLWKYMTVALAASFLSTASADAQEMRVLTSWDSSYPPVEVLLKPMLADLEEALDGQASIRVLGPETIPPFEQFEPVARGLFEMLYTNGGYHYDSVGIGTALDTFEVDHIQIHESGIWDLVAEQYSEQGLKLLGIIHNPGFHFLLKQPLNEDGRAFEGLRIRAIPLYHKVVQELGGSPVVLPMPEIYPALERGVVDGAAWPTLGAYDARWFEVANYLTRPTFGAGVQLFLMNLDAWDDLDGETQEIILGVARDWEAKSAELMGEVEKAEEEQLLEAGMSVTEFTPEQLDTVRRTFFEGGIELAAQRGGEAAARLRELAIAADLVSE